MFSKEKKPLFFCPHSLPNLENNAQYSALYFSWHLSHCPLRSEVKCSGVTEEPLNNIDSSDLFPVHTSEDQNPYFKSPQVIHEAGQSSGLG